MININALIEDKRIFSDDQLIEIEEAASHGLVSDDLILFLINHHTELDADSMSEIIRICSTYHRDGDIIDYLTKYLQHEYGRKAYHYERVRYILYGIVNNIDPRIMDLYTFSDNIDDKSIKHIYGLAFSHNVDYYTLKNFLGFERYDHKQVKEIAHGIVDCTNGLMKTSMMYVYCNPQIGHREMSRIRRQLKSVCKSVKKCNETIKDNKALYTLDIGTIFLAK